MENADADADEFVDPLDFCMGDGVRAPLPRPTSRSSRHDRPHVEPETAGVCAGPEPDPLDCLD